MRRSTYLSSVGSARAIALLGLILLVLGVAQPANATTGTLFIASDTTLTEDHIGEIVISADSVTLDCAGHLVTSDPSSWAAILVNNHDDVTVRNCRVTNGGNGIAVAGFSERTVVEDNEAFANANAGIAADQAVDTRIVGNSAIDNVGNGIQVIEATGVVLVGNVASENQGTAGIATFDAHECVFRGNTVVGNVNTGFHILESDRNVVAGNHVEGNGRGGIALVSANENSLSTNLVRANTDADSSGFFLLASSRNDLRANVSVANGFDGFEIADGSHANVLIDNMAASNPVNGFSVGRSNDNRLSRNVSVGNFRGFYIVEQERSIVVGNFAGRNGGFAFEMHQVASANWSGNSARGNGGGFLLDAVIGSSFIGNVSDAARESGGFHIFAASNDNEFRANASMSNAGPGFIVEGSNGNVFNLNVARENEESGFHLFETTENELRGNRSVDNVLYGFVLDAESNGNILTMNQGLDNGFENIALVGSSGNEVVGNLTVGSDYEGISLYFGSDHNLVKDNVSIGNATSGVLVFSSSHNTITGNRVTLNNRNELDGSAGIAVVEGSSFNSVVRNFACRNGIVDAYDDHSGVGNLWRANRFCTSDI